MDGYMSAIMLFGFDFAPRNWAFCNGQLLAIQQNQALFSLLGTTFGGNGTTTFALPDLRGRVAVGSNNGDPGPGLSSYSLGERAGSESITLNQTQMPTHNHQMLVNGTKATLNAPTNSSAIAAATDVNTDASKIFNTVAPNTILNSATIANGGGNQPHSNIQPYTTVNFCICVAGIFPSRN
jgi:microcystin-dependent protein